VLQLNESLQGLNSSKSISTIHIPIILVKSEPSLETILDFVKPWLETPFKNNKLKPKHKFLSLNNIKMSALIW